VKRDLCLTRRYPHPPELVWRALTDPGLLAEWLMPNDFAPEIGRRFHMRTDPAPGFDGVVEAEVLELDAPRRMRWSWKGGPIDTEVTFTLAKATIHGRPGTELTVEQTGFEGLPAVLVSFILGAGNRTIYGRRLPAVLDALARDPAAAREIPGAAHCKHGLWWVLGQAFAPVLRRVRR
jgi:uncharacterized protein YndB with AHSA1/START domain